MASSDSRDAEDEDESQIYQYIFDLSATGDKGENAVQSPLSPTSAHLNTSFESDGSEDKTIYFTTGEEKQETFNPAEERQDAHTRGEDRQETCTERSIVQEQEDIFTELDAITNIQKVDVKMLKRIKPWNNVDADITDYFNYGFNEETWKAYCRRQMMLRGTIKPKDTVKVQKGHTRQEKQPSSSSVSPGSPPTREPRQSSGSSDVEQPGPSNRVKERRRSSVEGNNTQGNTKTSREKDRNTLHPPPPSNIRSLLDFTPPPSLCSRRQSRRLSSHAASSSESRGCNYHSTSQPSCSSGLSSLLPQCQFYKAGVVKTAKAWKTYIQETNYEIEMERRKVHGRRPGGGHNRGTAHDSVSHNSREGRVKHRDKPAQGHKRHSEERLSGKKEGEQREKRHRDEPSHSNSNSRSRSGREDGEDRASESKHKAKKAKKKKKKGNETAAEPGI